MNAWAWALVDAFAELGVTHVVASPGSRSTPFLLAALADPRLTVLDIIDERSAAFFALGAARATGRPALLLCTSGTAGAHHFPAIIEASLARVPMLVLTADRPPELQGCGAPQTIDQTRLFGDHVRGFFAVPEGVTAARRVAAQAFLAARAPTPGPVHLNAHARKPLETSPDRRFPPVPSAFAPRQLPDELAIAALARACGRARRGLIACGPGALAQRGARGALAAVAAATGFPVVAEAASQLRAPLPTLLDAFDWLSLDEPPDLVLQLGTTPTSSLLERVRAPRAAVGPGWFDATGEAELVVEGEVAAVLQALAPRLDPRGPSSFAERLVAANRRAWAAVEEELATHGEGPAARAVLASVPDGGLLVVGNSAPIRLIDAYVPAGACDAPVLAQRGANGIDGLVSGAAGAAAVSGRPVTLLAGDVSFLHDATGLLAARHVRDQPLVIVILDNDGGRLFESLPVARHAPEALDHFTTPHGLELSHAAALAGRPVLAARDGAELRAALARAQASPGATLVHVRVPSGGAQAQRERVAARLA